MKPGSNKLLVSCMCCAFQSFSKKTILKTFLAVTFRMKPGSNKVSVVCRVGSSRSKPHQWQEADFCQEGYENTHKESVHCTVWVAIHKELSENTRDRRKAIQSVQCTVLLKCNQCDYECDFGQHMKTHKSVKWPEQSRSKSAGDSVCSTSIAHRAVSTSQATWTHTHTAFWTPPL